MLEFVLSCMGLKTRLKCHVPLIFSLQSTSRRMRLSSDHHFVLYLFYRLCYIYFFFNFPQGFRFASTTASLKTETEVDTRENDVVASDFTNRNPRNLEQLALARKERGWKTTWPKREFWHRWVRRSLAGIKTPKEIIIKKNVPCEISTKCTFWVIESVDPFPVNRSVMFSELHES